MQLTQALSSLVGNLRGSLALEVSHWMKPISYSHFLHLELGFLGGLENFPFFQIEE